MVIGPFGLLVAASVFAGASALVRRALPKARWQRRLRALATMQIADAKPGIVKLVGTVRRLQAPLVAPLSQRECVAYEIEAYPVGGDDKPLDRDTRCQDFLLDDGSGVALVRSGDVTLMLHVDATSSVGWKSAASHVAGYFQTRGIESRHELLLEEGDTVIVCGHGRVEPDRDPAKVAHYRDVPTRFVVHGEVTSPMLVSDDPTLVELG